ncbi:MAG: 4-hydroxy-2-oxoheptanedioate aldolase [Thermoleophilaceae bacterium]|jgi:2-keto-3-deoxy-L-rhamnonate aldolase RhmA|nr:4-hydroxy-2-oxoheptanedioate aldolase [Thermoleophilaceae bacterium]
MTAVQIPFGSRLRAHERLIGTVVTLPDVGLAELSSCLADFVWVDLEHGALGPADVQPLAIAARAGAAATLVRLSGSDPAAAGRALDAGADGVVVPRVESAAEAARVVDGLRYPPNGSRGFALRRGAGYGVGEQASTDPVCMVQVESEAALREAGAIAAVDGVDALVVGCADLALALGADPRSPSPRLRDAIAHVQQAAEAADIASGLAGPDDPDLLLDLARGRSTLLVLGADVRIFARALDAGLGRVRQALDDLERKGTRVCT